MAKQINFVEIEELNADVVVEPPAESVEKGRATCGSSTSQTSGDLKHKTARGAVLSLIAQAVGISLRIGSMMILARLLLKEDFGLVGMVAAFTGFLGLFRDAGLSAAAIQSDSLTSAQSSTLFWLNLAVGAILFGLAVLAAPLLALFYAEPRLVWVSIILGTGFVFNGVSAQHRALLQRELRFKALAVTDIVSAIAGIITGIGLASMGATYWSLVAMNVSQPAAGALCVWLVTRWIPGRPERKSGMRSMLRYGGAVTLNGVIIYLAYNVDKVLVGRFLGAAALGVYGRAYQLINLPTENLNSTIGQVAFPALSRVQSDRSRLRNYFLKGYSLYLSLVIPITMSCALFAEDIVRVFLGAKWLEAVSIFRFLAPTILAFALLNPFGWLLQATGRIGRSIGIVVIITPIVILGYALGLSRGPQGVAMGFSVSMALCVAPVILWARRDTLITSLDIVFAVLRPAVSIVIGAAATLAIWKPLVSVNPVFSRLVVETSVLFGVYSIILLFALRQKSVYFELMRQAGLFPHSLTPKKRC